MFSLQYTTEEWILKSYEIESSELIGVEGIWATLIFILILIVVCRMDCSVNMRTHCNYNVYNGKYSLESLSMFIW